MKNRSTRLIFPVAALPLAIAIGIAAHARSAPLPEPKPKSAASQVKPKPKPKPAASQVKPKSKPAAPQAKPKPAPPQPAAPEPVTPAAPPQAPAASAPPAPPPPPDPAELYQSCQAELRAIGVAFDALGDVKEGRCTVGGAVALLAISLPSGKVELPAHPRLACAFGLQFGRWIAETAAPIIAAHAGASLAAIATGTGFVCRNRNGDNADKLSEHGRGNAIDVVGFELTDHRRITIGDAALAGPLAVALKGLRTSACGYFTTVLGPGSNEAHKDHLHFDLGLHGKSDNYRICQ